MNPIARLGSLLGLVASLEVWPSHGQAQWSTAVQVGADRFWGGSVETAPERRSFRPYRPTTFAVSIQRRWGRVGIGLRLGYTAAGLALEGGDALVAAKGVFTIYSVSPEIGVRIASLRAGQLVLQAGPLFELWRVIDEDSRGRVGVQSALSLMLPLGGRFDGSLSVGVAVISSPFEADELDGFELRALWRRRLSGGLHYWL